MIFVCLFASRFTFPVWGETWLSWAAFEGHVSVHHVCVVLHAHGWVSVRACVLICGCLLERSRGLLTGYVSGKEGDSGAFETDTRDESQSERSSEKEGLFHVTLHSIKAQAERGTRRDMRHPPPTAVAPNLVVPSTSSPLLHPFSYPLLQSSLHSSPPMLTLTFIKEPHAGIPPHRLRPTQSLSDCHKPICLEYCDSVEGLSSFPAKWVGLETLTHLQRHRHMPPPPIHLLSFIVAPVTLSYSFNLSLEPADYLECVCTASGTMPEKAPLSQLLDSFIPPLLPQQLNIKTERVKECRQGWGGNKVDTAAQLLWWRVLLTCQGHVPHVDSRQTPNRTWRVGC